MPGPKVEAGSLPVRFIGVGPYSLDVEVAAYINTADYDDFLAIQQELLLRILQRSVSWADWDEELLALELQDFDLKLTGFDAPEIDELLALPLSGEEETFLRSAKSSIAVTKPDGN